MAQLNLVVGFTRLSEQRYVLYPAGCCWENYAGQTDQSEVVSSEIQSRAHKNNFPCDIQKGKKVYTFISYLQMAALQAIR